MTILLWLIRHTWRWGQDYPQPSGETPTQTIARMAREATYAEENRRIGGYDENHVRLMAELHQQHNRQGSN